MKKLVTYIFILGLSSLCSITAQCTLTIEITDIKKIKGSLYVALFDSEKAYVDNKYNNGKIIKVETVKATVIFEGLEKGEYAVAVFQDENGNGKLDTKIFGIPKEKYGFRNNINAMKLRRRPVFDECKFNIEKDITISIKLL